MALQYFSGDFYAEEDPVSAPAAWTGAVEAASAPCSHLWIPDDCAHDNPAQHLDNLGRIVCALCLQIPTALQTMEALTIYCYWNHA